MTITEPLTPQDALTLRAACKALDDKFASDITVLDISRVSVMADYFIIASGSNPNQMQAMANEVEQKLFAAGLPLHHIEGAGGTTWILMDFGSVIVHLFDRENRAFYNLERVWGDAKQVPVDSLLKQ